MTETTFLPTYRKAQNPEQTHFCPGCGHGNILQFVDRAICRLGLADRAIWVSPVGCGGLTDAYLSISHILAAHGRASAVATAVKRLHPDALVIVSQGDGDLASIGFLEALHAANRGENLTVIFVNNANFAMTGGQMAPTTPLGRHTATTPLGRVRSEHGAPIRVCEVLNELDGPAYIARVAIGSEAQIAAAERAVAKAVDNQVRGVGYSFVEILSPCPSNWHCVPCDARDYVAHEMTKVFPLGVFRDVSQSEMVASRSRVEPYSPDRALAPYLSLARPVDSMRPGLLGISEPTSVCCAGFGGQGVLTMGRDIAHLALAAGLEATWIPSYGPEMRGGVANCFVRISQRAISSPVVSSPDYVLAMNQPAADSFRMRVAPGGCILYNSDAAEIPVTEGIRTVAVPAVRLAAEAESERSANLVMLGAWLHIVAADIDAACDSLVDAKPGHRAAIRAGYDAVRPR